MPAAALGKGCPHTPILHNNPPQDPTALRERVDDSSQVSGRSENFFSSDSGNEKVADKSPQEGISSGENGPADSSPYATNSEDIGLAIGKPKDNQYTQLVPLSTTGEDNVIILSNSKGNR